jgi:hypothetical protein
VLRRKKQTTTLAQTPTKYPNGTFIETEKGYFYILSPSKRLRITHKRVLESWAPPRVVQTTEAAVVKYRVGSKLKYRNGSLIHNLADGKMYLVEDGNRRHITSPDVLERVGATWRDVTRVSLAEINLHPEGEPLV